MKSINLEIAQSEVTPNMLCWKLTSDGIVTSGVLEIDCEDDKAKFITCAAHAFTGVFKNGKLENSNGYCIDKDCRCHTGEELERVSIPFPFEFGPVYCCNNCASTRQSWRDIRGRINENIV